VVIAENAKVRRVVNTYVSDESKLVVEVIFIRPHHMHCIYNRCGLLPQMSHVAWSVCLSVLVARMCLAKTVEPHEMPFGVWVIRLDPRNYVLDRVEIPHVKGQFREVAGPIEEHWESLLRCMQRNDSFSRQPEMWAISDTLPFEAALAPSPSACQVSAQSSDARLSYCDSTDFPP